MTGTLTYTGVTGPAEALTAQVFSDVTDLDFNFAKETLRVTYGTPSKIAYLDLKGSATTSFTIVTGVSAAVTVSS
jgi:hypothetical protein